MPTFEFTSPEGKTYEIDGPDGATKEQAFGILQGHLGGAAPKKNMSLGEAAGKAAVNFVPDVVNFGKDAYEAVRHPIDTAGAILDVGAGELQKLTPGPIRNVINAIDPSPQASQRAEQAATGVNQLYGGRYGSWKGFKNAIAEHPASVLADLSVVAGGAGGFAKAGGLNRAAAMANKLGNVANPITLAAKGIGATGRGTGKLMAELLGAQTGTSGETIGRTFGAGLKGGGAADAFAGHITNASPIEEIVTDASKAVGNLRNQRGADYRAGIGSTVSDPTVLSLDPVDQAVARTNSVNNFKGVDLSPETAAVRQKVADALGEWKAQSPADFHTAEGLDALKKRLGFILEDIPYDKTANRKVVSDAYNAVKDEITAQSPAYAATMDNYGKASRQIEDIQKTLSLTPTSNVDTSIRKLQSALRDNVNTSYGRRADLAKILSENGAPYLMEKIAGQQLHSPTTRGIGKMLFQGEAGGLIPAAYIGGPAAAAALALPMAMSSPRLVGEAVFAAGKGARLAKLLAGKIGKRDQQAVIAAELGQQRAQ